MEKKKITEIFVWVADEENTEGVVAAQNGEFMMPLFYSNISGAPDLIKRMAHGINMHTGRKLTLKRFELKEVLEEIDIGGA